MHSLVVSTLFTHLRSSGCAVLRFNFRGVGRSEGEHDFGEGEQLDVRAAVETLAGVEAKPAPLEIPTSTQAKPAPLEIPTSTQAKPAPLEIPTSTQAKPAPLVLAGWSFGADLALTCDMPDLAGWFLVAPPLRVLDPDRLKAAPDPRPKWLAVPERDQFNPPAQARSTIESWANTEVHPVGGADHFLVGRTDKLNALLDQFLAVL